MPEPLSAVCVCVCVSEGNKQRAGDNEERQSPQVDSVLRNHSLPRASTFISVTEGDFYFPEQPLNVCDQGSAARGGSTRLN